MRLEPQVLRHFQDLNRRKGHMLFRIAAPLTLVALLAAGCGGDEQDVAATTRASATTGVSFTAQATAICEELADAAAQIPAPNTLAQLQEVVAQAVPLNEKGNDQIEGLPAPASKEAEWRRLLTLLPQDEALLQELGDAAAANDLAEVERVATEYEEVGRKENALWRSLGVPACTKIRLGRAAV
jgi:hypothetical protein